MSKWTLVKDKLPENRVGKIVYCEDGSVTMMYYDPEKKYWVSQMGFDRYDVLAWMEKPKPPRGLTTACTGLAGFSALPSESTLEGFTGQSGLSQPAAGYANR